eukprot:jgi/Mesvir1/21671/Mv04092-RA.1
MWVFAVIPSDSAVSRHRLESAHACRVSLVARPKSRNAARSPASLNSEPGFLGGTGLDGRKGNRGESTVFRYQGDASGSEDAAKAALAPLEKRPPSPSEGRETEGKDMVGVLLLNLGGPDKLEDVKPFLYNLFADPDIIRLPAALRFLQRPLAQIISTLRAPKSREGYEAIGGGSPLRRITQEQAEALQASLRARGLQAKVYVGMRYWNPFTEEAIEQIKADKVSKLVVLPLYPQFSISTSGSSLRLLEHLFRDDDYLAKMEHTVIPSWYQRKGYVEANADLIEEEIKKFEQPEKVRIFYSAHGVPVSYVRDAGDPYKAEMEDCVALIQAKLRQRGFQNVSTLAYQSRVGPVEWLRPYTDETIVELGANGCKDLLAVPISFVSEHIETLEEIDMEYRELALESGVVNWRRVPALNTNGKFIDDLADAVIGALPFVGAMSTPDPVVQVEMESSNMLVPAMTSVASLLEQFDKGRQSIPSPVNLWEWGWTKSAETWNGRLAMFAALMWVAVEMVTGKGMLHSWGIL